MVQRRIIRETNRYASKIIDDKVGSNRDGRGGGTLDSIENGRFPCISYYLLLHRCEEIAIYAIIFVTRQSTFALLCYITNYDKE